jgi:protein phosphatase
MHPEKPGHADIDAWGLTHPGKIREDNQDHFFLGSLARGVIIDRTSLGENLDPDVPQERLASFAMVADGVASGGGGEEASRVAVWALVKAVARSFHEVYDIEEDDPDAFAHLLQDAVLDAHKKLVRRSEQDADGSRFATTLTLFLGLWPHAYLLQVGDSRCYMFHEGELTQITRDQTVAQDLIDEGVLTQTRAHSTRWAHILSSAIGGHQAAPVVTRLTRDWGTVVLLCSDGLTKHVPDERIKERMLELKSSRQLCEDLLQDALDDGGSDNISLVVGRTLKHAASNLKESR